MTFHTHYLPKVYTASKIRHASMWRDLRTVWRASIEFTARWPDLEDKLSDDSTHARHFWMHDIQDVVRADALLLFAEPHDHLRGALVEAGAAIATGKHVVLCGHNPDFGTWQFHPMVTHAHDLEEARLQIIGPWRA